MTEYTPEQLREEATQLERENCDVMKVDQRTQIALLRAHAAALEELARLKAPVGGSAALLIKQLNFVAADLGAFPAASNIATSAASLIESLAAKVAELTRELSCSTPDSAYIKACEDRDRAESALATLKGLADALAAYIEKNYQGPCPAVLSAYRAEFKE